MLLYVVQTKPNMKVILQKRMCEAEKVTESTFGTLYLNPCEVKSWELKFLLECSMDTAMFYGLNLWDSKSQSTQG